jgi:molybdate transport system ATP-binding protein
MLTHLSPGKVIRLSIRANDVAIATEEPRSLSFRNILKGTLAGIESRDDSAFATVLVDIGNTTLKAELTRHAVRELRLEAGMPVFALLKTASFDHSG